MKLPRQYPRAAQPLEAALQPRLREHKPQQTLVAPELRQERAVAEVQAVLPDEWKQRKPIVGVAKRQKEALFYQRGLLLVDFKHARRFQLLRAHLPQQVPKHAAARAARYAHKGVPTVAVARRAALLARQL